MATGEESTHLLPRIEALECASVSLRVLGGPEQGTTARLTPGITRIGTAPSCHVRLTDAAVSRVHCEVRVSPEGINVIDGGSTNGTWVDGVEVVEARVVAGSTLRIGQTTLRVDLSDEPLVVQLSDHDRFGDVIGSSAEMRRVYAILGRICGTESTVLVQGETGTGKEIVARAIHAASPRAAGPFVPVDCGAIAENFIDSELFGHVRGAFPGALVDRRGLFEEAGGGTIFLDEVGELPLPLQPKLLRALEMREVRPVGANASRKVDVRVIAATNRPLARGVNEGAFREDLLYRLAVCELVLPPLRARREDIPMLAAHFQERITGSREALPDHVVASLMTRAWPGNVRELKNLVERSACFGWAATHAGASAPTPEASPVPVLDALVPVDLTLKDARKVWTERFESLYVAALLRRTGGNVTKAAERADVNRRYMHRLIAEHGIRGAARSDDDVT